jgi:GNAT superfamily N-acetyltransferase
VLASSKVESSSFISGIRISISISLIASFRQTQPPANQTLQRRMAEPNFFAYDQSIALQTFLPILYPHLPYSNPLYNRIQAPHNTPSRHCLFAATFPPTASPAAQPAIYTIIFADRSRHQESQIWLFNSLSTSSTPLSQSQQDVLASHLTSAILFLKEISIPQAPGWPFSPRLRFACLHETITSSLVSLAKSKDAMSYITEWNAWNVPTLTIGSTANGRRLPEGFTAGSVPEDQLDVVLRTSSIQRQPSTYLLLPSVGLLNTHKKLVAWGYIGIDSSFATLYVLPEYRGKGLASYVAKQLLTKLGKGEFKDMGFEGKSGWVHSDVKAGNEGSERVMSSLGARIGWKTSYCHIDSDKF